MKIIARRSLFPFLLALAACATARARTGAPASSGRALAAVEDASSAALQADEPRALEILRAVPAAEFQEPEAAFRTCMLERFGGGEPPAAPAAGDDAFADQLLAAYRMYWWRSLTRTGTRDAEEARLLGTLEALLGPGAGKGLDDLEPPIAERLKRAGLHVLLGLTRPMRELMLWSREDVQQRDVELPDGTYDVRVVVLDGFRSLGWGDWATCGRHGAGGWADADALYVVRPRYHTLDDEKFRVSFLGHETQHLADRRRLPGLDAWQMEYRAKLTELALARDTRLDLLESFARNQGDDPAVPHSYADRRVLADLRSRLGLADGADLTRVPSAELRDAARAVLREDTRRAEQRSPSRAPTR